jgi:hypothetical protein
MWRRLLCLLLALILLGLAPLRGALAQPLAEAPATGQAMPCHEAMQAEPVPADSQPAACPVCGDGACALCVHCAVPALPVMLAPTGLAEAGHGPWVSRIAPALSDPPARVPQPPPRRPL